MMRKLIGTLLFLLLFVSAAAGQSTECIRDSFFPEAGNCGYDVIDYNLQMVWSSEGDLWDVIEDLTFISEWDSDELHFDFTDSYEIYGMTIDGVAVDFTLEGQDLTIRYNFAHDTEYHLYAGFRGKLNYGFIFDPQGSAREEGSGFCMLNEPTNAWRYYVCSDHPKDKATYHYSFTVPASFTPAGVGRLLEIREADGTVIHPEGAFTRTAPAPDAEGTVTFTYAASEPMAPYMFTVCAFSYDMKQKVLFNGIVELDFVDRSLDDYELAWKLADEQEAVIEMFASYMGEYPYQDLGAIVSPTLIGAALETQTRPMYDVLTIGDSIFAHEIMHQWFGDLISLEDWSDIWIKEGAATFGEYLYLLNFKGQEAYENELKQNYVMIAAGNRRIFDISDLDMDDWFRDSFDSEFNRQLALETAESLCRMDEGGTIHAAPGSIGLPEGDTVTGAQWVEAMNSSCKTVSINHRSVSKFLEMTGVDLGLARFVDSFPGPKEISTANMYSHAPYYGGSFVYYALQQHLGDDIFWQGMQKLLERCAWSTVNEEIFIDTFSETAGEDLGGLIRSWLCYEEGHVPDLPGLMTREEARAL